MPTRVNRPENKCYYLGIVDPDIEMRIGEQLAPFGEVLYLRELCRRKTEPPLRGKSDVMIVSPCVLRGVLHGGWPTMTRLFSQAHVMVMVGDDDVRDHRDLFSVADGWVIGVTQLNNLRQCIELGTSGYQTIPHTVVSGSHDPQASREQFWSVSESEFATLTKDRHSSLRRKTSARWCPTKNVVPFVHYLVSRIIERFDDRAHGRVRAAFHSSLSLAHNSITRAKAFSDDRERGTLLSWIIRAEFVALLGIALYSGRGVISLVLHALLSNEHAPLLIVGCAVCGWLLRVGATKPLKEMVHVRG